MGSVSTQGRRQYILDYIRSHESADVSLLSNELGVSEMTIRRDFMKLEEDKKLIRVHGGAVRMPNSAFELPLNNRLAMNRDEKDRIGSFAAGLVEEGDVAALDASTTALMVAEHLQVPATVVTNNVEITVRLLQRPHVEVVLLGGHVRKSSASTVGFEMSRMMQSYRVDKLFFSSKASNSEYGISDATVEEGEAKKAMIASAEKRYLMLDHSKLNTTAFYKVCDLDKRFEIITDRWDEPTEGQKDFLRYCRESGITIHFV